MNNEKRLKIGDPESIKARDEGRIKAWKKEFEKKFRDKVSKTACNFGCDDYCYGPDVIDLFHKGIEWACSKRNSSCDCCGQDMEIYMPITDFKGNSIEWVMSGERKSFDPEVVKDAP